MKAIWDSAISARESESSYLSGLHYLILWKRYPDKENTWEPAPTV